MYIEEDKAKEIITRHKKNLLKGIQDHKDFLFEAVKADDWSFVIKAHALIEAAVTNLLTSSLGDERTHPILERLPLSDSQVGKICLAKELDLLNASQRKFLRWFSELRNPCRSFEKA